MGWGQTPGSEREGLWAGLLGLREEEWIMDSEGGELRSELSGLREEG